MRKDRPHKKKQLFFSLHDDQRRHHGSNDNHLQHQQQRAEKERRSKGVMRGEEMGGCDNCESDEKIMRGLQEIQSSEVVCRK